MHDATNLAGALVLAALLGFAAHKAGICMVKAVAELATSRRPFLLLSFAKTSAWSFLAIFLAGWLGAESTFQHWPMSWLAVAGGIIFGIGAGVNGGCVFSTLTRVADGRIAVLGAVAMWPLGTLTEAVLLEGPSKDYSVSLSASGFLPQTIHPAFLGALLLWAIWELYRIFASMRPGHPRSVLLTPNLTLSTAALLIGASNGFIYQHYQNWSFTSAVNRSVIGASAGTTDNAAAVWLLLIAAFTGMVLSAFLRGSIELRKPQLSEAVRHVWGGFAMGFGSAMIPGGNDAVILYGIPSHSPHALPAIAGIILGIAVALAILRAIGGRIPIMVCKSDVCISP